jgi:hypothetical protein
MPRPPHNLLNVNGLYQWEWSSSRLALWQDELRGVVTKWRPFFSALKSKIWDAAVRRSLANHNVRSPSSPLERERQAMRPAVTAAEI